MPATTTRAPNEVWMHEILDQYMDGRISFTEYMRVLVDYQAREEDRAVQLWESLCNPSDRHDPDKGG